MRKIARNAVRLDPPIAMSVKRATASKQPMDDHFAFVSTKYDYLIFIAFQIQITLQ